MGVLDEPKIAIPAIFIVYFVVVGALAATGNVYAASAVAVFGSVLIYVTVALVMRAATTEAFYVAGRDVGPISIGSSIASNWMSGASFVSMAGAIAILGYDGLPYIIGWTLGYVIAAVLIAPFVRRSGTYTVPEFIETRSSNWPVARVIAVLMLFVVSFTYLVAQLVATGVIIGRFLGVPAVLGAMLGSLFVILFAGTGGWRSVVWVQVTQYWVLIVAYWIGFMLAAAKAGIFKPWPHIGYGDLLAQLEAKETSFGLAHFTQPFKTSFAGGTNLINWILGALALMLGTVGLPHVLSQFYLVKDVRTARYGVGWGLTFIGLLYLTAPVYAILARYGFSQVWGMPIEQAKQVGWIQKWLPTGLVKIADANNNGILDVKELSFHKDIVVIGMPDMWGLAWWVAVVVAVGGLAAALSTANGLLMVMTVGATRDIYKRFINPNVTEEREVWVGRGMLVMLAAISALAGARAIQDPTFSKYVALLVGWAFVFASSLFTPSIIMGIFWKGLNRYGIVAGMIAGLLVSFPYIAGVGLFGMAPIEIAGGKIGTIAWGVVGFLVHLIVAVVVSLATGGEKANPPETIEFVDRMKIPE